MSRLKVFVTRRLPIILDQLQQVAIVEVWSELKPPDYDVLCEIYTHRYNPRAQLSYAFIRRQIALQADNFSGLSYIRAVVPMTNSFRA